MFNGSYWGFSKGSIKENRTFSIDYKVILDSKFQLIDRFKINDIYKKDSSYYVSIKNNKFYFTFPITKEQLNKILDCLHNNNSDEILIVNITEVRKIPFEFSGKIDDTEYATLEFEEKDWNRFIIGKGILIDIVSVKYK